MEKVKKVNFKTTAGILEEIEDSINEFKEDIDRLLEVELRIRGCNSAIKVHMLNYVVERLETVKTKAAKA